MTGAAPPSEPPLTADEVLTLRVLGTPGTQGRVELHSRYDRTRTADILRLIAAQYERSGPA